MGFSIYSQSCATIITINFRIFSSHSPKSIPISSHFPLPPNLSQPLATTDLISVSMDLPALCILYQWDHIRCGNFFIFLRKGVGKEQWSAFLLL